ncbi:MAG TPA: RHS repeat-associated core domain-containing protein [Chryseolinea sp.]|nr:RHS repeat-associated core domain-containing protein [Chryseolinea sp.]
MDSLTYHYYASTNRLKWVDDSVALTTDYTEDLEQQSNSSNYTDDAIGNLKTDVSETLTNIDWTVYGKIASIVKSGHTISYTYDAAGNRISKTADSKTTLYVRDASGNVMSVYEGPAEESALAQKEAHLYGSARLGMTTALTEAPEEVEVNEDFMPGKLSTFTRGEKLFELSNHLGNVLATVNDKKMAHDAGDGSIDYYIANVTTAQDYYPFGMLMPGRKYAADDGYRYGFNGQEKSYDVTGGNYTAEFWEYDSRIGRRWNVDPVGKSMISGYAVLENNPIIYIDPFGNDWYHNKKESKTEWFDSKKEARSAGYNKHLGINFYSNTDNENTRIWHGSSRDDMHSYTFEQNVTVIGKGAKPQKWGSYRWFDGTYHKINRDFQSNLGIYIKVRNGDLSLAEALKDRSFAEDYGSDEKDKLENHYKAEKEWRAWQYGAVGVLLSPFVFEFGFAAAPHVTELISSAELPALYTETSLYAWRTTTLLLNSTKARVLLGIFSVANKYIPFSWKRAIVNLINTPLPNVVTPKTIETIIEQFFPGPTMKK